MKEETIRDEKYAKKILVSLLLLTILVVLVISLSFSLFLKIQKDSIYREDRSGKISMNYTEETNGISIVNATPITDEVGMNQTNSNEHFDFTVKSSLEGNAKIEYEIAVVKDSSSNIDDKDIRLYLEEQKNGTYVKLIDPVAFQPMNNYTDIGSPKGSMVLKKVAQKESGTKNYRLKMWLAKDSEITGDKKYTVRINVYGKQISGGSNEK